MTQLFQRGADDALYILDISGYVFRAYHAITPLESPSGEPTAAVMGTLSMMERLLNQRDPGRIVVAMDSGSKTFRSDLYPEYKAHRPPAPDDLISQLRRVEQLCQAWNLPVLRQPGVEADDLIATAVKHARAHQLKVVIVSADKDLLQLVGDDVVLWDTMRNRVAGTEEVLERFGVRPDQMRDLLALMGDSADNVPGVPSVGKKTAQQLLSSYDSIEGVYANLGDLKRKKLREALELNRPMALLSQQLVTLKDDCPIDFDLDAMARPARNVEKLRSLYSELGFQRHLLALEQDSSSESESSTDSDSRADGERNEPTFLSLSGQAEVDRFVAACIATGTVAVAPVFDTSSVQSQLVAVAFAAGPDQTFYASLDHRYIGGPQPLDAATLAKGLHELLLHHSVQWVAHDTKRARFAVEAALGLNLPFDFDTQLASYLLTPEARHSVEDLSESLLGAPLTALDVLTHPKRGTYIELDQIPVDTLGQLMTRHAAAVLALSVPLRDKLESEKLLHLFETLEMPLSRLLTQLEQSGVLVDGGMLELLSQQLDKRLTELHETAHQIAGRPFNVNSPRQLETLLFDELKLKPLKRTKTSRSTDAATLEALSAEHELPAVILEIRQLAKLKGTYLDALPSLIHPKTARIHTRWGQVTAATGRLASSDPNLQNIPIRTELGRQIRQAFIAPEGHELLSADYSQIELRVLAHLSQDPVLLESFRNNEDVHTRTAQEIFQVGADEVTSELRRRAKAVNFGVVYGQGESGLAKSLGIARADAARFISEYFQRYSGVHRFMEETLETARQEKKTYTLLGRVRQVPDIKSSHPGKRAAAERVVMNTPIQGTAADLMKLAMLRMVPPPTPGCLMTLTVHDELVFEVPSSELQAAMTEVRARMESVYPLDVPLLVDIGHGPNWDAAH